MPKVPIEDPVAFHHRFWADSDGDSEAQLQACERRLGVALPVVLNRFYASCGLRESQQIHLATLDELVVKDDLLIFAREQQGVFSWGVRVDDGEDPRLFCNNEGPWQLDGGRVSDWLQLFTLINRPYEDPCSDLGFLEDGFEEWSLHLESLGTCQFAVRGSVVADAEWIGARTMADLNAATGEDEEPLAEPYHYKRSAADRMAAFMARRAPSAALAAIIGPDPVTRSEALSKTIEYLVRNKLQRGQEITLDDKLRALFGDRPATFFELPRALEDHLEA